MVVDILVGWIVSVISTIGYPGISVLMALESMVAPIPSEAVMPFAGYLVFTGKFNLFMVIAASSIGSMLGSMASYYMGFYGGKPIVLKIGKYLLLDEKHLDFTNDFFKKYGSATIFISRFVPVVRHLISIPAGMGKMSFRNFFVYTLIGATAWNSILVYLGMKLGENWNTISGYGEMLDFLMAGLVVIFLILYVIKFRSRSAAKKSTN